MLLLAGLLLLLQLVLSAPGHGPAPCPPRCLCYDHSDLVDCRARGFLQVPQGLPHGTGLLDLGGNVLTTVRRHAFAGLWSLRVLVLSDSAIQHLRPQALVSLTYLEKLDLSGNVLRRLPPDFSSGLSSLRELRLDHNRLELLEVSSLESLETLEKLDLSHNRLTSLQPGGFRGLSRLRHLDLRSNQLQALRQGSLATLAGLQVLHLGHNNISRLDAEALAPLLSLSLLGLEANRLQRLRFQTFLSLRTSSTHLQLSHNPWSCDCDLHRVFGKVLSVRHLHVDDYANVTCGGPPQLAGASLAWVDGQLCVAETVTVLVIALTVLVAVMAAVAMAEHTRKKNQEGHRKTWDTEPRTQT